MSAVPTGVPIELTDGAKNFFDLSWPLDDSTIFWPGGEGFQLCMQCCSCSDDRNNSRYDYAAGVITCAEHGGTHVDACFHFCADGKTVEQIPVKTLIAKLKIIDVIDKVIADRNYAVTVEDIQLFENNYGKLNQNDIVLIRTAFCNRYPLGAKEYLGFDEKIDGEYDTNTSTLSFPGISMSAAEYFVHCRVAAVGLDTASLDPGNNKYFDAHRVLLSNDVYGIENVNDQILALPCTGANIIVAPLKITGGSGSPARIFAYYS